MSEKERWGKVVDYLNSPNLTLGRHWSYNLRNDPKRLAFVLSRYKFAAKMACKNAAVLELGCSEGIGAPILRETATSYLGIDFDEESIKRAKENFPSPKYNFLKKDFMNNTYGSFDAIVSLDVIEHIAQNKEELFLNTILKNLSPNGICVIGTPNITTASYASKLSQIGHINLFTQERFVNLFLKRFYQVFPFSMNDEIVHTGFSKMAHYLLCVAFHRRDI